VQCHDVVDVADAMNFIVDLSEVVMIFKLASPAAHIAASNVVVSNPGVCRLILSKLKTTNSYTVYSVRLLKRDLPVREFIDLA